MKVPYAVSMEAELVERLRAAAAAEGVPLAWIVVRAVEAELTRLEAERGRPFRRRTKALKKGRPRKAKPKND